MPEWQGAGVTFIVGRGNKLCVHLATQGDELEYPLLAELHHGIHHLVLGAVVEAVDELVKLKLPRFRGVVMGLGDYGSAVTSSMAAS
jgi:hypothetical protein